MKRVLDGIGEIALCRGGDHLQRTVTGMQHGSARIVTQEPEARNGANVVVQRRDQNGAEQGDAKRPTDRPEAIH